jgi:mannan endo-1,4-beta-mannosidase
MSHKSFVTRVGNKLYLDHKPFRFAGPNIYWLGLDENVNGVDWPTEFRVLNVLDTAKEMGATVVRSHTLGASHGCSKAIQLELGVFNEEALRKVDFAIKSAGERNLRLIIPFVCNWSYYHGGIETFTKWRGLEDRNEFYRNKEVVADFKAYISVLLNRINSYTGISYKEDPTILAWELGNELNEAPVDWVEEIVKHIKELDGNHLVAHGKQFKLDTNKLVIQDLDILDVHYYPADAVELKLDAEAVQAAGKVFIAGEYGWPDCKLDRFLTEAEMNEAISGTLFWSLFSHHDQCGFVQHFDGFTVHYPGNGVNVDVMERVMRMRSHAYIMRGKEVPEERIPDTVDIEEAGSTIVFRGVVGAAYYTLEKSTKGEQGPWNIVYDKRPADHHMPWIDPTRIHTLQAWYRIKAYNLSGTEGQYSPVHHAEPFRP